MLWPQGQVQRGIWIISTVFILTIAALFVLDRTFMDAARGKNLAGILQSVVTVVAIAGGGVFAYYKLQVFRGLCSSPNDLTGSFSQIYW